MKYQVVSVTDVKFTFMAESVQEKGAGENRIVIFTDSDGNQRSFAAPKSWGEVA